jgi:hypothetical protein
MIFVTFISIHFVIICDILLWRTYQTHPTLPLKSGCDRGASWSWDSGREENGMRLQRSSLGASGSRARSRRVMGIWGWRNLDPYVRNLVGPTFYSHRNGAGGPNIVMSC